jgi:LacI family transcriptional regulator
LTERPVHDLITGIMKRVTLADVARDCGVSTMTVSYVVRGIRCVRPETEEKVKRSLKKLGYQAEPMLRALAAYRSQKAKNQPVYRATIAFLDSEVTEFSQAFFHYAAEEARFWGYQTEYIKLPSDLKKQEQLSHRLWSRGIQGLLLGPCQREDPLHGFNLEHFALVGINAMHQMYEMNSVCMDYFQGLYLAAKQCYQMGARHIGLFLASDAEMRTGHRWLGAYCAFCDYYQIARKDWIFHPAEKPTLQQVTQWVKQKKIEVLLTLTNLQDIVPTMKTVSLNDWDPHPDWSYIQTPRDLLAREAVRLLDQCLCHHNLGRSVDTKSIFIHGKWRDAEDAP